MVPTRARTEPGSTIRRLLAESVNELIREGHRNLILTSADTPDELSRRVETPLEVQHRLKVRVLGRMHAELAKVVADALTPPLSSP